MTDLAFVIDHDVKRRTAIVYYLNNNGFFAEPFECVVEFSKSAVRDGYAVVYDQGIAIASLFRETIRRRQSVQILGYSEKPAPQSIVDAVLNGALGYFSWTGSCENLVKNIRASNFRSRTPIFAETRRAIANDLIANLTSRETEILAGMAMGRSSRQMSGPLNLSPRTVEFHRARMLQKIGAKSSAEAILIAIDSSIAPFARGLDIKH